MGLNQLVSTLERWLQLAPLEVPSLTVTQPATPQDARDAAQRAIDAVFKDLYARQAHLALGASGPAAFRGCADALQGALGAAQERLVTLVRSGQVEFERAKAALDRLEEGGLLSNAAYWRAVSQLERGLHEAS